MEKEEVKLSLFAHDMILFVENPKESIKKKTKKKKKPLLPEPINDFCKVTGFKIKHKTSQNWTIFFLHSSNEQSKDETKKKQFHIIASERVKYLGINLTKEVNDLYTENKMLLKEIKDPKINGKSSHAQRLGRLSIVGIAVIPALI